MITDDFTTFGNLAESSKAEANHATDFTAATPRVIVVQRDDGRADIATAMQQTATYPGRPA